MTGAHVYPHSGDAPRRSFWCAVALCLLALAAYGSSFDTPFLFDDHEAIDANPTIKRLANLGVVLNPPAHGSGVTGRPLVNLSLALNYALGGTDVRGYHVFNFLMHAAAGLALLGIARRTLALPALRERLGGSGIAWLIAAAWTLHPLQTESVTCVIQRTEVLVGFFYLATLYCFIRAATARSKRRAWSLACVAACLLGMASKEVMVSAPLLVLLYDRTFLAGSFAAAWRTRRALYIGLASTWLLLAFLVLGMGGTRGEVAGMGLGISPFTYLLKQCEAITRYLWLTVWPHPLVVDYGEDLSVHPIGVWLRAASLVALALATTVAVVRRHALGFVGIWFFAILSPSSSFIPLLTQTVAEHRMYLPLAAVLAALIPALALAARRHGLLIGALVLAALVMLTAARNHDYRSGIAIWTDTVAKAPRNSRAHHNLGVELAKFPERFDDALASFRRALECKPTDLMAHYSLAFLVAQRPGGKELAIAHYEAALRINPHHLKTRINLANELAATGRRDAAIAHLETALQISPRSSMAHNNLANELALIPGRAADAMAHYTRALALEPDDPEVHFNYANVLAKIPERSADAVRHYARAIELRPGWTAPRLSLANHLAQRPDRSTDAIAHYDALLSLDPNHAVAHYNLGVLLANHGRNADALRHFEAVVRLNPDAADARRIIEMLRQR